MKRGGGIEGREDKSSGIEIIIPEAFAKIKKGEDRGYKGDIFVPVLSIKKGRRPRVLSTKAGSCPDKQDTKGPQWVHMKVRNMGVRRVWDGILCACVSEEGADGEGAGRKVISVVIHT
jgi:hypothetical protein